MALVTDYNSLVENVSSYFERAQETDFLARIPTFIALAEAGFNRNLKARESEHTVTLVTDADGYVSLPSDWIAPRSISVVTTGSTYLTDDDGNYLLDDDGNYLVDVAGTDSPIYRPLKIFSADAIASMFPYPTGGYSDYVSISGNQLRLLTNSASEVQITYFRKFVGLSEANPTNWLMEDHPDLYLFATMAHAAVWLQDFSSASVFKSQADVMADEANSLYAREIYNSASLTLEGDTP